MRFVPSTPTQQVQAYYNPLKPKQKALLAAAGGVALAFAAFMIVRKIKRNQAKKKEVQDFAQQHGFTASAAQPEMATQAIQMTAEQRRQEADRLLKERKAIQVKLGQPSTNQAEAEQLLQDFKTVEQKLIVLQEAGRIEEAAAAGATVQVDQPAEVPTIPPEEPRAPLTEEQIQADLEWQERERKRKLKQKIILNSMVVAVPVAAIGGMYLLWKFVRRSGRKSGSLSPDAILPPRTLTSSSLPQLAAAPTALMVR